MTRKERIERLLAELKYELTRGMMEREIDENLGMSFVVPTSKTGAGRVVQCDFRTYPTDNYSTHGSVGLKVVK